ncbi:MAG: T9SS type A sorting domain-containing protein, partial [Bacteroidetes bacterium]|nr:T9SS type A sorting domain-containing protein [Bacteroidota bacterium]
SVPETHGDKYKIAALDTCGNESELSFYHKTINLTIAAFGSTMGLNWDDYVDESGAYTPYRYYIYRGLQPNNMDLLDSVSGSFNSYNDNNVFELYYYMIGVKKPGGCDGSKSTDFMAFSNQKDNEDLISALREQDPTFGMIQVSPNPFTSETTISFGKPITEYRILITDPTGKVVFEDKNASGDKYVLQRRDLESGMYLLEITNEELRMTKKLVIN